MIDLGKQVYFVDQKSTLVRRGIVAGSRIADGWGIYTIFVDDPKKEYRPVEEELVFLAQDEADARREQVYGPINEASEVSRVANKKIDELRVKVIGEPVYKELWDYMNEKVDS